MDRLVTTYLGTNFHYQQGLMDVVRDGDVVRERVQGLYTDADELVSICHWLERVYTSGDSENSSVQRHELLLYSCQQHYIDNVTSGLQERLQ